MLFHGCRFVDRATSGKHTVHFWAASAMTTYRQLVNLDVPNAKANFERLQAGKLTNLLCSGIAALTTAFACRVTSTKPGLAPDTFFDCPTLLRMSLTRGLSDFLASCAGPLA